MTTWIDPRCEMNVGWLGEHPILCDKPARFKDENGNWRCAQHWDEQEAARAEKLMRPADEPVEDVEDL